MSKDWDTEAGPFLKFFVTRIFPLFFLVFGGGALLLHVQDKSRNTASLSWPTEDGVVVSSEIKRNVHSERPAPDTALVVYKYSVDGNVYEGDRVRFGDPGRDVESTPDRVVKRYPPDAIVTVFYRPDEPSTSVLEPGTGHTSRIMLGVGSVFFICGVLMMFFLPKWLL